jgi:presenilin-like A22 family membrane protease
MNNALRISIATVFFYGLTFAIGIAAAFRHVIMPQTGTVAPLEPTLQNALIFALVFGLFTAVMIRYARTAAISLRLFLLLALAAGTQFVLAGWFPLPYSIGGALLVVALARLVPVVLVHDLSITLGIAGVAGVMGLSITPLMACVLLAALAIYDIISVYRTRHMVALAGRMLQSGAVFGFLVPGTLKGFFMPTSRAIDERQVMMLGSGDIGLPLVLATSAVSTSIGAAVMVTGFSLAGLMLMNWLFAHQKESMPMAALPPIAASAILGFVLATLLGI